MLRIAFALLGLLLLATPASADVEINRRHFVANQGAGVCCWCSTEMGCRALGHYAGYGLAERHRHERHGAPLWTAASELTDLGVPHEMGWFVDVAWIKRHTDAGEPVIISFWAWSVMNAHAVTVYAVKGGYVYFVDCNDSDVNYRYAEADFNVAWSHLALAIGRK